LKPLGYRVGLAGKRHYGPPEAFPFERVGGAEVDLAAVEQFIRRDDKQPYCLIVADNSPHTPWNQGDASRYPPEELTIPPYLFDTPETRSLLSKYYAEVTHLDEAVVAPCLRFVEESGAAENTLVIFTSEQGSPMLFGKFTCYDLGLKTAFLVRWPRRVKPGSQTDAMAQYVDIVPTLVEAAGGALPEGLDGQNFLPVLEGRADRHRDYVYGVQTTRGIINGTDYPIRSIRDERYKLIMNLNADLAPFHNVMMVETFELSPVLPSWERLGGAAAARARFYAVRPREELYDVIADPWEQHNLAGQAEYARVVTELRRRLLAWMEEQGDQGLATEEKANERQVNGSLEQLEKRFGR
ncbi:MAG: sulfatase, partial [Planctomycetota bacterium]